MDAFLDDPDAIARIKRGLAKREDLQPQMHTIHWISSMKFGGIKVCEVGKFLRTGG